MNYSQRQASSLPRTLTLVMTHLFTAAAAWSQTAAPASQPAASPAPVAQTPTQAVSTITLTLDVFGDVREGPPGPAPPNVAARVDPSSLRKMIEQDPLRPVVLHVSAFSPPRDVQRLLTLLGTGEADERLSIVRGPIVPDRPDRSKEIDWQEILDRGVRWDASGLPGWNNAQALMERVGRAAASQPAAAPADLPN